MINAAPTKVALPKEEILEESLRRSKSNLIARKTSPMKRDVDRTAGNKSVRWAKRRGRCKKLNAVSMKPTVNERTMVTAPLEAAGNLPLSFIGILFGF